MRDRLVGDLHGRISVESSDRRYLSLLGLGPWLLSSSDSIQSDNLYGERDLKLVNLEQPKFYLTLTESSSVKFI